VEECDKWQQRGYIGAVEREGQMVEGYDLGNSPFSYMNPELEGKNIAFTTTNGTEAIVRSSGANQVLIGSFLNYHSLVSYLKKLPYDIIVLCAGWKGKVNMEDTIFAGAVVDALQIDFDLESDAARVALETYRASKNNMLAFLDNCSHIERLKRLDLQEDIMFCLQYDKYNVIPILKDGHIVKMSISDMLF
jgi:2-phosphosulfolactate phosphatase